MTKLHMCGEDVCNVEPIYYDESLGTWQMATQYSFYTIKYCPFCGLELAKGTEMGWPIVELDTEEQGHHYHMPLSKDTSQIPF